VLLVRPIGPTSQGAAADQPGSPIAEPARIRRAPDTATLGSKQLTDDEQREVDKLKQRDRQVRTHEEAHKAAAGPLYRGGPTYKFKTGPDGRDYAIGGSVKIDTGPGRTPEETIQKAQQIRRAALAPADPSSTDRAVAAKASRMESEARAQLNEQRATEANGRADESSSPDETRSSGAATPPAGAFDGHKSTNSGFAAAETLRIDVYA
jgi:hypothetical protein